MITKQAVLRSNVMSLQEEALLLFLLALRIKSDLGDSSLQISTFKRNDAS